MAITDDFPTGHATLSDGSTTIPFIFTDGNGKKNQRAFTASPYPRQALKTTTGESKYSDLEPPYFAIAQDDFTGGRGNEDFENDTSRYFDGHWLDTSKEGGVVLGGRETYSTGYRNADQAIPGAVTFQGAYVATRYLAVIFASSANYTSYQCEVWVKKIGSPGDLQVELWSSSELAPNAMLASKTLTAANITTDVISLLKAFVWTGSPGLDGSSNYWVVIDGGSAATATNHWAIGCDAATAGKKKATAGGWSATTYSPYYRITPAAANFVGKFFEYKRGLYMVTQPESGGNSVLYINGDRGAADNNSGNKGRLNDATKTDGAAWTADEWIGDIVLITKGPGSDEEQPWRTITDNDTNWLGSAAWNVTHTTATEYVILGSDKWTELDADLGAFVTDVAVAGEFIWLAKGGADGDDGIHRYRFYNKSGVWTAEEETTSNAQISDKLLVVNHTDEGEILYSSTTTHALNDISIYKARVPRDAISLQEWLFYPLYEFNAGVPWKAIDVDNVTNTVDAAGYTKIGIFAAHTTGTAAAFNLDTPVDIRDGQAIVAEVKTEVALSSGDYKWLYDDVEDLGKTWSPVKVLREDNSTTWSPVKVVQAIYTERFLPSKVFLEADFDGTPVFTDLTETYDGDSFTDDAVSFTADDYLWIGATKPFNKINVNIGITANAVVCATRRYEYYAGANTGTDLTTVSDGTIVTTNTPLEQTGVIGFDHPPVGGSTGWKPLTVNETEAYWVRIRYESADLTASVNIKSIYLIVDEKVNMEPSYLDLTRCYDGSAKGEIVTLPTEDYLWIGSGTKFNKIYFDLGTVNAVASTMTAKYFDGSLLQALSITDATETGSDTTLGEDEYVTFTIPNDWEPYTVDGNKAYWVRLDVSVALTPKITILDIRVTEDEANAPKTYTDMTNAYDGLAGLTQETLTWPAEDFLYIGHGTKFNKITVTMDGTDNTVTSTMTAKYFDRALWQSVTITDGTKDTNRTLYKTGDITFTIPNDWRQTTIDGVRAFWIRLIISASLTEKIIIKEISVTRQNNITVGIPALATTGEWTTIMTDLSAPGNIPDASSIKSIGLQVAVDKTANIFHIRKLWLAQTAVDSVEETSFRMPGGRRINGMQAYAGNVDDPILNPWIFTTDAVYEMQTQNNDQIVQIPLEELGALSSSENGLGHCVNGTYLYFNIGEKIERYFNRTLDDIGPDRDEGLPTGRAGIPKSLASYPGRVYAAIDAGASGTSSVLALGGSAWHEVYRAPDTDLRIKSIFVQAIPGTNVDRLWISMGSAILWIPVSLNPNNETDFKFTHEGHLITSYIYAGMMDVKKLWKSLKLFTEQTSSGIAIQVDYQLDVETAWTSIGTYNTDPVEEINIASTLPNGRRIRFRLRFITDNQPTSPRLKSLVVEGVAFVPTKTSYSWTFAIKKTTENINLKGAWNDSLTSVAQYDKLLSWANAGTPLTLAHHSTLYDGKTVFMDPISVSPLEVVDNIGKENHIAQLTCFEV